jgi:serine/threonine-protein kinase
LFLVFLTLACVTLPGRSFAQSGDDNQAAALAVKAQGLLKQYCYRCHGQEFAVESLDVLNRDSMTRKREDDEPYVIPGKADKSLLYRRFGTSMPPKKVRERPTQADREIIKKWIDSGAPGVAAVKARKFVSTRTILLAMRDWLDGADKEDRPYLRFFTLTHLHNDPRTSDSDLRSYKAALSKVINSLSWKRAIIVPKAVDKEQTVFAVDLRDLDWDRDRLWRAVLAAYPYGLRYNDSEDGRVRQADRDLFRLSGSRVLPYVRGDWFVNTAARPPLYHILLQLPRHAAALEHKLGVNVYDNFRRNKVSRGAFATSGVSGQNRLVERHEASYGAYWKSYDFKEGRKRGNLFHFPLGPRFRGNHHDDQAFEHDGGEIIFNLPNGLQGYLLVDGKDNRIDQGPEEVVNDALKTSGTPAIVNGLSCMACHKHGVINFKDEVRIGNAVSGDARLKVRQLYPTDTVWKKLLQGDEERFLTSLEKAIGPFVRVAQDKEKPIKQFPEPVGDLARRYKLADLKLIDVALELGLEKPEILEISIKANSSLRELGLATLVKGGAIKRAEWERIGATSLFQRVARELELGHPWSVSNKR